MLHIAPFSLDALFVAGLGWGFIKLDWFEPGRVYQVELGMEL